MKIAIPAQDDNPQAKLDARFGRARFFVVFDEDSTAFEFVPNTQNLSLPQGAGIQAAKNVIETGAGVLIASNVGPKAFDLLQRSGVQIYYCEGEISVRDAVERYRRGVLVRLENANQEGHW